MSNNINIALLMSVGGSIEPLIKSIENYQPSYVVFFASQESNDKISEIKKKCKFKDYKFGVEFIDEADNLIKAFKAAEEAGYKILNKKFSKENILVDYTGGTKVMSAALALATARFGFKYTYVGGEERNKKGLGIVKKGKEKIKQSVNPWDFWAVDIREQVAVFVNAYEYSGAIKILENNLNKFSDEIRHIYEALIKVIKIYDLWDNFKYEETYKITEKIDWDLLKGLFKKINLEKFVIETEKIVNSFLKKNIIQKLEAKSNYRAVSLLIKDIYLNALRRAEQGNYDDAVLRFYRLLEFIAQNRLFTRHDIDDSKVPEEKIPKSLKEELAKYRKCKKEFCFYELPLYAKCKMLLALRDEMGKKFDKEKGRMGNLQQVRNHSFITHGFKTTNRDEFETAKKDIQCFMPKELPDYEFPKI